MRILDADAVAALIDDRTVLEAMRHMFSLPSDQIGLARVDLRHPKGWLRSLPAYITGEDLLGFKVLHQTAGVGMRYTIHVHRLSSGQPLGMVDGLEVTNLRTGAVSAVATDHLARREIEVAAIVGTGPIGRGQLRVIDVVRPAAEVRVFARSAENRQRFIEEMRGLVTGRLVDSPTLDAAVGGSDLVTLATKATSPILTSDHLRPGMHINSVGPASRDRIEVDPAVFSLFDRVVCDSARLVLDEAGDAYQAVSAHGFDPARAEELGDLVTGAVSGRTRSDEVTLFKSVGTGAQDLMVAARLLELAEARGLGSVVADINSVKPIPG